MEPVGTTNPRPSDPNHEMERLRAELAELRQQVARSEVVRQSNYEALVDSIDGIVWEADANTFRFSYVSRQAERLLGYPVHRWTDEPGFWKDHIHPDDVEFAFQYCVAASAAGLPHQFEYRMIAADGRVVWLRDFVSVLLEEGRPVTLRGIMVDVTDRRRTEQALQTSEERLRLALAAAHMGVWQWDIRRDAFQWTPDTLSLFGLESGEPVPDFASAMALVHEDDRSAVSATLRAAIADPESDGAYEVEFRRPLPGGELRWLTAKGRVRFDEARRPVNMVGTVMDVTDRRRLESQLQQSQKMETVGRLAGVVAHDFNNMLTVILGEAQLALYKLTEGDPLREHLTAIAGAGERAGQLTSQLLAFARKQVFQLQVLDPGALLRDLERLLRRVVGEDIDLRTHVGPDLWRVRVDPHQIGQVVINLAVNARDAMPSGGILTIEVANITLNGDYVRAKPDVAPGEYVLLAVSDTGVGMDPAVQEHVFEPFFTTKVKGTGLGLATCYGIVKQHGGHIWVYSEPGQGATFKVYLPRAGSEPPAPIPQPKAAAVGGNETVLLVEDEPQVRALAERGLRASGYQVLAAADGEEALAIAASFPGPIHAVITDVVMPNMSGRELAERLSPARPEARILFVSGYTEVVISQHGGLGPGAAFLQKPFTPSSLVQRLRELLDAK